MYIVLLKFSDNRAAAPEYMDAHNTWLKQGFDDGVFVLGGSLQPGLGGAIFACNTSYEELESRVNADPFVAEKVVSPEILDIQPMRTDDRLAFLAN